MSRFLVKAFDAFGNPYEETIEVSSEEEAEWKALGPRPSFDARMAMLGKGLSQKSGVPVQVIGVRKCEERDV